MGLGFRGLGFQGLFDVRKSFGATGFRFRARAFGVFGLRVAGFCSVRPSCARTNTL